jgi:hypothetical protein
LQKKKKYIVNAMPANQKNIDLYLRRRKKDNLDVRLQDGCFY